MAAAFGFETVSGWRCGAEATHADQVQVCSDNTWRTFWHDGQQWKSAGGTSLDTTVPAGSAMIVVRKGGDAPNPFALIPRPYDL